MRWARDLHLRFVAVALAAALGSLGVVPAAAAPSGNDAVTGCQSTLGTVAPSASPGCRGVQFATWALGSACRNLIRDAGVEAELRRSCESVDGRVVNADEISAYEASWTHRAIGLQRALDDGVALTRSLLPHTHNSFNAPTYAPTLTNQDPNQVYSLTDQLRMDVRAIELDVHWVPSIHGDASTGFKALSLCHGNDNLAPPVHVGCTTDRPFAQGLDELALWMNAPGNTDEVVLLYLENAMDNDPVAHNLAATQIADHLGDLVARPPDGQPCAPVPTSTSRSDLRAAGRRILIVGNCGPGAWGSWVHERDTGTRWYESSSGPGDDYPGISNGCAAERARTQAGTRITRWYDDSTAVAVATSRRPQDEVTANEAAAMVACGVNLVGFDQLKPDGRLSSLVWSWAPNRPTPPTLAPAPSPRCAYSRADGRFVDDECNTPRSYTCSTGPAVWMTTTATGPWSNGAAACLAEFPGSTFAVPPNGWENGLLRSAAGAEPVWLAYADQSGTGSWTVV